eukprot:gene11292-15149_t
MSTVAASDKNSSLLKSSSLDYKMLLNKKTILKMGITMNDNAASQPSSIAMKLMKKMGWEEGKGLGKNEDGMSNHIKMKKREDNVGLGSESAIVTEHLPDQWWHNAYSSNLQKFKNKKESSKKKKQQNDSNMDTAPTFEELFHATGGARLGMRARADQKGKFKRTENISIIKESSNIDNMTEDVKLSNFDLVSEENSPEEDNEDSITAKDKKKRKKEKKRKRVSSE